MAWRKKIIVSYYGHRSDPVKDDQVRIPRDIVSIRLLVEQQVSNCNQLVAQPITSSNYFKDTFAFTNTNTNIFTQTITSSNYFLDIFALTNGKLLYNIVPLFWTVIQTEVLQAQIPSHIEVGTERDPLNLNYVHL